MHKPLEAGKNTGGKLGNWLNEFEGAMSYFDDNEDQLIFSRYRKVRVAPRRGYTEPANPPPVCNRCGKADLKWKWNDNGNWQLFEAERGEHNRNVPHQCAPTTAADFDDCSDLV